MLQSNVSTIDGCIIVDVKHIDLEKENYLSLFIEDIIKLNKSKIIFNLEDLEIVTSDDIQRIEKITKGLHLSGISSIVCGFSPYCAAMIFSFIDNVSFETSLNIKGAIDAFSTK
ncbi:hypothetical protein [Sulfurospirillum arcachonense]|uniref:hypothetical protein n=1 Tax=Sulfurospirillum arcachonense TaxID=57666 RepID=UPI0004688DF4|nr:hypothetical protein [Sulfurospirillum arcachonense]